VLIGATDHLVPAVASTSTSPWSDPPRESRRGTHGRQTACARALRTSRRGRIVGVAGWLGTWPRCCMFPKPRIAQLRLRGDTPSDTSGAQSLEQTRRATRNARGSSRPNHWIAPPLARHAHALPALECRESRLDYDLRRDR
jgi:hypothetical protein